MTGIKISNQMVNRGRQRRPININEQSEQDLQRDVKQSKTQKQ
jgi:hypothetical protein